MNSCNVSSLLFPDGGELRVPGFQRSIADLQVSVSAVRVERNMVGASNKLLRDRIKDEKHFMSLHVDS